MDSLIQVKLVKNKVHTRTECFRVEFKTLPFEKSFEINHICFKSRKLHPKAFYNKDRKGKCRKKICFILVPSN